MNRQWSALINKKLHFDTEQNNALEDIQTHEENMANVIIDHSLEFLSAGVEVCFINFMECFFKFRQSSKTKLLADSRLHNWHRGIY